MSTPTNLAARCPSHPTFVRRIDSHDARIDTAEARIDGQDSRIEAIETRHADFAREVHAKLDALSGQIEGLSGQVDESVTRELVALRKAFEAQAIADAQRKAEEETKARTDFRRKVLLVVVPIVVSAFVGSAGTYAASQCSHSVPASSR
jgi:hypothetical protein